MDSVVSVLMQNPGYSVEVQGHTDSKGSDQYNEKLSQKRAEEAKGYIVGKGITKERVIAKGYGEKVPLAGNDKEGKDDPEGRARNRRVEFKILPDKPEDAPEIEYNPNEPVEQTKTGPGWNRK
jgi:outer membrane protein OmpA-like peptidoglycan-associated protein